MKCGISSLSRIREGGMDCLSVIYEVNQSRARLVIPIAESLFVSMVWSIVWKAEDKSRRIIIEP